MNVENFLVKLKGLFNVRTDRDLAEKIGIDSTNFSQWKSKKDIPASSVIKTIQCGINDFAKNCIQSIVEFYPVERVGAEGSMGFIGKENAYAIKIRDELQKYQGVYSFYDSYGELVYVGKTKDQNLLKEMKVAFNKTSDHLFIWGVKHPQGNYRVTERQIVRKDVYLHDVAMYFSAYHVDKRLINTVEALLIRSTANNNINIKMERIPSMHGIE